MRFLLDDFPKRTGLEPKFRHRVRYLRGRHPRLLSRRAPRRECPKLAGSAWSTSGASYEVDEVFRLHGRVRLMSLPRTDRGRAAAGEQADVPGQRPDRLFGLLDTEPLERLVLGAIPWQNIRRNLRNGPRRLGLRRGDPDRHRACGDLRRAAGGRAADPGSSETNIRMQPIRLMPVHALASAAIPLLFPAVRVGARATTPTEDCGSTRRWHRQSGWERTGCW